MSTIVFCLPFFLVAHTKFLALALTLTLVMAVAMAMTLVMTLVMTMVTMTVTMTQLLLVCFRCPYAISAQHVYTRLQVFVRLHVLLTCC
jgi:hypothetical protein